MTEITETESRVAEHDQAAELEKQARDILFRSDSLLAKVLEDYDVFLMGSFAFGYSTIESDIDICVNVKSSENSSELMKNLRRLNFRDVTPAYNSRVLEFHGATEGDSRVHIMMEADTGRYAERLAQHARLRHALKENTAKSKAIPLVDFIGQFKEEASWNARGTGKYIYRALVKLLLAEQPV